MQSILQDKMEQEYEKGKTKKDAYPKCLGISKPDLFINLGYDYQRQRQRSIKERFDSVEQLLFFVANS